MGVITTGTSALVKIKAGIIILAVDVTTESTIGMIVFTQAKIVTTGLVKTNITGVYETTEAITLRESHIHNKRTIPTM